MVDLNMSIKHDSPSLPPKISLPRRTNIMNQARQSVVTMFSDQTESKMEQPIYSLTQSTTPKTPNMGAHEDDDDPRNISIFNPKPDPEQKSPPKIDVDKYKR